MKKKDGNKIFKILLYIKVLYVIQVIILLIIILYRLYGRYAFAKWNVSINVDSILLFLSMLMLINGYLVIKDVVDIKKWKERFKMREEAYDYIQKLNLDLRMQRHDFLNHIQIIYSLMELEEYNECMDYLNKLYGHIGTLSENIKTDKIAINALLQAKANEAEKLHIDYHVAIRTRLSGLIIPEWEICRCLGNLIDNAFTATLQCNEQKEVHIEIEENLLEYIISVTNSGDEIEETVIYKIFESGFTTKVNDNREHGMGLYIVKNIMNQYESHITIDRLEGKTVFAMRIPKDDLNISSSSVGEMLNG